MSRAFFCLLGVFTLKVSSLIFAQGQPVAKSTEFDVLIKNGTIYDGTGAEPKHADVAIRGDRIAGVGDFKTAKAKTMIDANGLAVTPGFINMLSWSVASLIQDGRSQSEIRQGVTTEIMGEGESMGPVNDRVRENVIGFEDKQPTPAQLDQMRELVRKEMEAGALGIGTSLIYPPAFYAKTEELIEL